VEFDFEFIVDQCNDKQKRNTTKISKTTVQDRMNVPIFGGSKKNDLT
jgi:hypothetical protein